MSLRPALLLVLALSAGCAEEPAPAPRGVLLISVDSLRADHVSAYGYRSVTRPDVDTTPIVDRMLAAEGVLFENASSTTSWTLPSHMSMLTGLPNELHAVREIGFRLDPRTPMLSELFRDAGWRTAGFWSGPNLDPWFGFDRGFERYVDCSTSRGGAGVFEIGTGMSPREVNAKHAELKEMHDASHVGITGDALVASFREWFGEVGDDEPFFAFVHMWDVHYDYTPKPEFDLFDPDYRGEVDGRNVDDRSSKRNPPSEEDRLRIVALYDGEIRMTDHNIGLMLDELRARGRLDDTLVVFTSDHGEEFLEHGNFGHGNTLFEEVTRVPLILRYPPALPAGTRDASTVSIVDIAPTILELCRVAAPPGIWGTSLLRVLDEGAEGRLVPLERSFLVPEGNKVTIEEMRGTRGDTFKLVRDTDSAGGRIFFYDLEADPDELSPVLTGQLGKGDPRVRRTRELWQALDAASRGTGELGELPEDLEDRLEDFGYLGNDETEE